MNVKVNEKISIPLPLIIFITVLVAYYLINPKPSNLFQHYVYIADSFLKGHTDIIDKPWHYGDYILRNGKVFFQYGPAPAIFLMPLVIFFKTNFSQTYVSMIIGAINAVLIYKLLLRKHAAVQ